MRNGGINGILNNPIPLDNGPVFDDYIAGYGIILDAINYTYITLDKFLAPYNNGYYSADITVHMIDAFGLDRGDIKRVAHKWWGELYGTNNGFKAWWVLQHVRGYVPFKIYIDVKVNIQGNVNDGL